MPAGSTVEVIEGAVTIAAALFCLLLGNGMIPLYRKDPQKQARWLRNQGKALKTLAPLVVLFGLAKMFGLFA